MTATRCDLSHRRPGTSGRAHHPAALHSQTQRARRPGPHLTRPSHPGHRSARTPRLAAGDRLWPPVSGGDRDVPRPDADRPQPTRPKSAGAEGRGPDRLCGDPSHDPSRQAGVLAGRLTTEKPGLSQPTRRHPPFLHQRRGETYLCDRWQNALNQHLPSDLHATLSRLFDKVKAGQEQARSMDQSIR